MPQAEFTPIIFLRNPQTYHLWSSLEFVSPFMDYENLPKLVADISHQVYLFSSIFQRRRFCTQCCLCCYSEAGVSAHMEQVNYLWAQHDPLIQA